MGKIADVVYDELFYMYCDNCRYNDDPVDKYDVNHCEDCHRKYNGWAISRAAAEEIEKKCFKNWTASRASVEEK